MIVWLASYPRSGNTFFRVILNSVFDIKTYSIYDDKGDIGADEKTSEVVGHEFLPENFDIKKARDEEKTYYIKTHELLDDRINEKDKVIYLIRDGRESTLSLTKHENTFSSLNLNIIDTIYGNTFIGSWGDHVKSWDPKNRKNTLLIKFETLIKEPIKYIKTLSEFLHTQPIGDKIPTFNELKKINPKFFRSGKTNSWEEAFSDEEHMAFWVRNHQVMLDYGYEYKKISIDEVLTHNRITLEIINQNNYLMNLLFSEKKKLNTVNYQLKLINQKLVQEQTLNIEQTGTESASKINQIEQLLQKNKRLSGDIKSITTSKRYKLATLIAYPYLKLMGKI